MRRKIVHIVESFGGGVFSLLVDLVNNTSNDYEITILYGKRPETPKDISNYFNQNVKLIQIKNFTRKINLIKDIKSIIEVKKYIKTIKPDIVHLHSSKAGAIGRIACKNIRVLYSPHCFSFMQKGISKIKKNTYYLIEKIMSNKKKSCIIACSKQEFDFAKKLTSNVILIENGVNIEKIEKIAKNTKQYSGKHTICTAGRIDFQKNPKLFNQIAEKLPEYAFTWIGDGASNNILTSPNIKITGWLSHDEVIRIINENEIFLLTSKWEGLPITLLEALCLKKKCIISNDIQNIGVIKNGENGYIAGNINDYINCIKNTEQCEIKEEAYEKIKNEYNMDTYVQKYKKLIEENKNRVILFTEKFNDGGIERVIVDICSNLNKEEYNSEILTFTRNTKIYKNIQSKTLVKKTPRLSLTRKIKGIFALKKYLKYNKIDIFHVNIYNATGLIYAQLALKMGVGKIVVHAHNSGIDNDPFKIKKIINYLAKKIFSNKNFIYVSASKQCEKFCFKENSNSVIIPNEIDARKYIFNKEIRKEYRKSFGFNENDIIIGNIGRLEKQKNHEFLIDVFEKVHKLNKKAFLVIIGAGKLRKKIEKRIRRKKLNNAILLLEQRDDINKLMQMFDIYVSTSKYEGFGLTILEAQAASLPIICTSTLPEEVRKTKNIHTASLMDKPEKWAEQILNNVIKIREKKQVYGSAKAYVKKIEKIYKNIAF